MNKTIFTMLALVGMMSAKATVWQVNNEPGAAADYTSLPDAITAATAGDSIYLYPGTASYGSITLDKLLFILGPGHAVDYTSMTPQVDAITFTNGSSGCVLKGFRFAYVAQIANTVSNDVLISGCLMSAQNPFSFPGNTTTNNWIMEGCVVYNQSNGMAFNGAGVQNWILRNNIFTHWNASGEWIKYATNMLVENNIFIQTNSATGSGIMTNGCTNVTFNNNIVYYTISTPLVNTVGQCTNCSFSNNITYSPSATLGDLPGTNFNNINPEFVNVPLTDPFYAYSKDYQLLDTSAGNDAGLDGEDIGVFGGIHDFRPKGWSNTLPRVGNITLLQNNTPPGGQLQINLKAASAGN